MKNDTSALRPNSEQPSGYDSLLERVQLLINEIFDPKKPENQEINAKFLVVAKYLTYIAVALMAASALAAAGVFLGLFLYIMSACIGCLLPNFIAYIGTLGFAWAFFSRILEEQLSFSPIVNLCIEMISITGLIIKDVLDKGVQGLDNLLSMNSFFGNGNDSTDNNTNNKGPSPASTN